MIRKMGLRSCGRFCHACSDPRDGLLRLGPVRGEIGDNEAELRVRQLEQQIERSVPVDPQPGL